MQRYLAKRIEMKAQHAEVSKDEHTSGRKISIKTDGDACSQECVGDVRFGGNNEGQNNWAAPRRSYADVWLSRRRQTPATYQ